MASVNTECAGPFWIVIVLLCCGICCTQTHTVDDEILLRKQLLDNSSGINTVRPTRVTLIQLSFTLISINTVDLKNEQFGVSGWWSVQWEDLRLTWDKFSLFEKIPVIQAISDEIWTPALVVDNSVDDLSAIKESSIPLRIRKDGQVTWNPPGIVLTACEMVVTYFPFDIQTCSLQVTSFGYTIQELNVSTQAGISTKYYQENGEWTIMRTWNERSEYEEDGYTYAKVTFYFKLQRRSVYYGLNTMLPVLLNSLLIPLVFLLPHDSGEKIGYCLTVLLAYVVILTIVTDGLPTTAKNQSLLGLYITVVLTMSAIAVGLAIQSLTIYHRSPDRPVPVWLARLSSISMRIMRLRCAQDRSTRSVSPADDPAHEKKERLSRLNGKAGKQDSPRRLHLPEEIYGRPRSHKPQPVSSANVQADMSSMTSEEDDDEMTWQRVAQAYDAFFLRLYLVIIFCSSLAFFLVLASNQF
ncbi:5-hydroxytryptamine receptor 3A-like [Littorina saxatilis]|uniref:5-hydroxytryptamine receptor 3A-like n=1 Tax=Littorina saxatilis TaxID=31220 RepID=UPI0038B46DFF